MMRLRIERQGSSGSSNVNKENGDGMSGGGSGSGGGSSLSSSKTVIVPNAVSRAGQEGSSSPTAGSDHTGVQVDKAALWNAGAGAGTFASMEGGRSRDMENATGVLSGTRSLSPPRKNSRVDGLS